MQNLIIQSLRNRTRKSLRAAIVMVLPVGLSGCLLTSPFWNQELDSHTDPVPMQAFTVGTSTVKFECAQAAHFGLYPSAGSASWVTVANVVPTSAVSYDPNSGEIHSAGIKQSLPNTCWRQDPANNIWYAAVRASHTTSSGTSNYYTFTLTGLECLGRENGKAASWYGWFSKNCAATYSGSSTTIPYVIIRAPS